MKKTYWLDRKATRVAVELGFRPHPALYGCKNRNNIIVNGFELLDNDDTKCLIEILREERLLIEDSTESN